MSFLMSSIQRAAPYSAMHVDTIVELLEKIYAEEIRLKARIKTLEQQLLFSKTARALSPVTPLEMDGSVEETMETPTVGCDESKPFAENSTSPSGNKRQTSRVGPMTVQRRTLSMSRLENP